MSEPTVPASPEKMPLPPDECEVCNAAMTGAGGRVFHPKGRPHGTTIALFAVAALFAAVVAGSSVAAEPAVWSAEGRSVEVAPTRAAQAQLRSYGYTIAVDGVAGPQTAHIVELWQRANALPATRQLDTATVKSLRIEHPATSTRPAVRLDPPPPPPPVVEMTVEEMIRSVWPAELANWAVRIAYRESRFQPHVKTWCCYGVFQIHKIHLEWLCPQLGICTIAQLYDPLTNVQAAYALYQRDGKGPWSL